MVTTWAPRTASRGSVVRTILVGLVSLEDLGVRRIPLGTGEPELEAEAAGGVDPAVGHVVAVADTGDRLAPQPPRCSRTVIRSASTWQGWSRSVRPLITGIAPYSASSSTSLVEGADHDAVEVAREHPGGVRIGSPRPSWMSRGEEERVAAELVGAASKETRVRVEVLAKIMPRVLPASGCSWSSPAFHAGGEVEQVEQLGAGGVGDREEVPGARHRSGVEAGAIVVGRTGGRKDGARGRALPARSRSSGGSTTPGSCPCSIRRRPSRCCTW